MSERQPYSRVYWTIRSDPRLASIYPNNDHLATWMRLLLAADMAWPAPADVPASVKRSSLTALVEAGVVELLPGGNLFRFHGLDTERGRRRDAAQASAGHRAPTERRPNGDRTVTERSASRAEPSRDETRQAEPSPASGPNEQADDPLVLYADLVGRRPTQTVIDWINRLSTSHGDPAVCSAIVAATRDGVATNKLLGAVEEALSAAKREAIRRRPKVEAGRTWRDDFRDLVAAGYEEAPA